MNIREENIFFNLQGDSKYEIINSMIASSKLNENLKEIAIEKVKLREEIQPTFVGNGIGLAHAKFHEMEEIQVILSTNKLGVEYGVGEDEVANIIFVVLAPLENNRDYLEVLARIGRVCRNKNIISKIKNANSKKEILDVIEKI
ncbi:PTS sugar transporter subunit IIA [Haliovirga abyssi]|uniref:PTS fructose transporter subunit IIA n=1 Tax=Haliovirga abyssi TaxID=2996794 RepID=A0AAU9D1D7_9FUSO|nr:PTS sugar transporter subunit IIA [Haliovirga abyssi]BDU49796.1 PTS fructose transporter subunit IIA [Haliovirga abyssi]